MYKVNDKSYTDFNEVEVMAWNTLKVYLEDELSEDEKQRACSELAELLLHIEDQL